MSLPTHRRYPKAFTLIEVIVVFLLIAVLASVAAVAYNSVVDNSKTQAAQDELGQFATGARALALLDGRDYFTADDVTRAVLDQSASEAAGNLDTTPGVEAAPGFSVNIGDDAHSTSSTNVAGMISGDGHEMYLSMTVPGHGCAFANATIGGHAEAWGQGGLNPVDCNGGNAKLGKGTHITPAPTMPPAAPDGVVARPSGEGLVALTWNAVDGATSYTVYSSTDQTTWTALSPATTTTTFTDTHAAIGVPTYYQVAASNKAGVSTPATAPKPITPTHLGYIETIAGGGTSYGDGGLASKALLQNPTTVAFDQYGNIYIADTSGHRIREVNASTGIIHSIAGTGSAGNTGDGGPATAATMGVVYGIAVDSAGDVYLSDNTYSVIRKVTPDGVIHTVAGAGAGGFSGDGGPATAAKLKTPFGLTLDTTGDLFVADTGNNRIRKITPAGIITTVAGNGGSGRTGNGGAATAAALDAPEGVAVDSAGNLYVTDYFAHELRKINPSGIISLVAGNGSGGFAGDGGPASGAQLWYPRGVSVDPAGNVFIDDVTNGRIREISAATGIITTVAGKGAGSYSGDGQLATATLMVPIAVATDAYGDAFIVDQNADRVLEVNLG